MEEQKRAELPVLEPSLQLSFYHRLQALRRLYLHDALKATIQDVDIQALDDQLAQYVGATQLKRVASFGLRGEIFFPVPILLEANPFLLGYYRLLFGLSQKEFYQKGPFGRFKRLEDQGIIAKGLEHDILPLCLSLIKTAQLLVEGIDDLSLSVAHDLQLLTLGPQLRGSRNTELGQGATQEVFDLIAGAVTPYLKDKTQRTIRIENDSHRSVLIEFFSDPDVRITEQLPSHNRPLVSIEIKGGADVSNVHNRLGEAEKSHQKARNAGFFEFWTILRASVDLERARGESPTTSRFFNLDRIQDPATPDHKEFRDVLASLLGIRI